MAHNPDEDYELPEFESDFEEEASEERFFPDYFLCSTTTH